MERSLCIKHARDIPGREDTSGRSLALLSVANGFFGANSCMTVYSDLHGNEADPHLFMARNENKDTGIHGI